MNIKISNLNTQSQQGKLFDVVVNVAKDPIRLILKESVAADEIALSFIEQGDNIETVTSYSRFVAPSGSQVYRYFGNTFSVPLPSFYVTNIFHAGNNNPLFFKHTLQYLNITDLEVFDQNGEPADNGSFHLIGNILYHNLANTYDNIEGQPQIVYFIQYSVGTKTIREILKRVPVYTRAKKHASSYSTSDLVYFSWVENGLNRVVIRNEIGPLGIALIADERQSLELIDPMDADKLESWFMGIKSGFRRIE